MFEKSSFVLHFTLDQTGVLFGSPGIYIVVLYLCFIRKHQQQGPSPVDSFSEKGVAFSQIIYAKKVFSSTSVYASFKPTVHPKNSKIKRLLLDSCHLLFVPCLFEKVY